MSKKSDLYVYTVVPKADGRTMEDLWVAVEILQERIEQLEAALARAGIRYVPCGDVGLEVADAKFS